MEIRHSDDTGCADSHCYQLRCYQLHELIVVNHAKKIEVVTSQVTSISFYNMCVIFSEYI